MDSSSKRELYLLHALPASLFTDLVFWERLIIPELFELELDQSLPPYKYTLHIQPTFFELLHSPLLPSRSYNLGFNPYPILFYILSTEYSNRSFDALSRHFMAIHSN